MNPDKISKNPLYWIFLQDSKPDFCACMESPIYRSASIYRPGAHGLLLILWPAFSALVAEGEGGGVDLCSTHYNIKEEKP
jgi:hypothetical protein